MANKICSNCFEERDAEQGFHKNGESRRSTCKECDAAGRKVRREKSRALAGTSPPVPPIPDGFEVRGTGTEVNADGVTTKQWIAARPEAIASTEIQDAIPFGHVLKGVSTLVDESGNVRAQWIKTGMDRADERAAAFLHAMTGLADKWKGLADPVAPRVDHDDDLLCVYPMGDPHLGMFAWGLETGDNFDLEIAERNLCAAVDQLVAGSPAAKEALIINLGDFFHSDNSSNQTTRSHHALDVDTRWAKVLRVGIRTMRRCIDRALEKHGTVRVICEIGNHDDHSSIMLALCLEQYYEREPRVVIDTSPALFHWYRFGANLIGTHHGHTTKLERLPGVMACDRKEDWGQTDHRYFYTGHVHHDSAKEYPGVIVETFRTLAPKDAYAAGAGYRAGQDMKCDVVHKVHGRIQRNTVGVSRLKGA